MERGVWRWHLVCLCGRFITLSQSSFHRFDFVAVRAASPWLVHVLECCAAVGCTCRLTLPVYGTLELCCGGVRHGVMGSVLAACKATRRIPGGCGIPQGILIGSWGKSHTPYTAFFC
mgnify:CR=1 FL=1